MDIKEHWEKVYKTKTPDQVSWTQKKPQESLDLIHSVTIEKSDAVIDIGGGDSNLVDFLLEEGYSNITVLDISAEAIKRAKHRLGMLANKVTWIVSDIVDFKPTQQYKIWHDRAAFHFLTNPKAISSYCSLLENFANRNVILGVFSTDGPLKCSGIEISQYDKESLINTIPKSFSLLESFTKDHLTPFETTQNFLFCSFQKK